MLSVLHVQEILYRKQYYFLPLLLIRFLAFCFSRFTFRDFRCANCSRIVFAYSKKMNKNI